MTKTNNLLFAIFLAHACTGQSPASRKPLFTWYESTDSTLYSSMHKIMDGLLPVSYASFKTFGIYPVERPLPLREGEGRHGYLLETSLDQVFPLVWNKNQEGHFTQTFRCSFRYAPALRISKDDSYAIIPTNQKVGLQCDKVLWDNQTKFFFTSPRGHRYDFINNNNWMRGSEPLQLLYIEGNLMHYSNGQSSGVYASTADSLLQRNDYRKGDFTTNFFNFMVIYSRYKNSLLSFGLGSQFELGKHHAALAFNAEQEKRYGRSRLLALLQYRTRPLRNPITPRIHFFDPETRKSYIVDRQYELRFRLESEYILGDLSDFKRSRQYRMNAKFTVELNFLRARSFSLFADYYYGRDYMNIRYDDIIQAFHTGISISLLRYRAPRFDPLQGLKEDKKNRILKYKKKFGMSNGS